jgi:hypothetical protein
VEIIASSSDPDGAPIFHAQPYNRMTDGNDWSAEIGHFGLFRLAGLGGVVEPFTFSRSTAKFQSFGLLALISATSCFLSDPLERCASI